MNKFARYLIGSVDFDAIAHIDLCASLEEKNRINIAYFFAQCSVVS